MYLDEIARVIGYGIDPGANHTVSAGAIPLRVLDVRRRVLELEPLGDAEQHGPTLAGEPEDLDPDLPLPSRAPSDRHAGIGEGWRGRVSN